MKCLSSSFNCRNSTYSADVDFCLSSSWSLSVSTHWEFKHPCLVLSLIYGFSIPYQNPLGIAGVRKVRAYTVYFCFFKVLWIQCFLQSVALNWHLGKECFGQKSIRPLGAEKILKLGYQVSERQRIIWCCVIDSHFFEVCPHVLFLKCNTAGYNLGCIFQCFQILSFALLCPWTRCDGVNETEVKGSPNTFANYRKMKIYPPPFCAFLILQLRY